MSSARGPRRSAARAAAASAKPIDCLVSSARAKQTPAATVPRRLGAASKKASPRAAQASATMSGLAITICWRAGTVHITAAAPRSAVPPRRAREPRDAAYTAPPPATATTIPASSASARPVGKAGGPGLSAQRSG